MHSCEVRFDAVVVVDWINCAFSLLWTTKVWWIFYHVWWTTATRVSRSTLFLQFLSRFSIHWRLLLLLLFLFVLKRRYASLIKRDKAFPRHLDYFRRLFLFIRPFGLIFVLAVFLREKVWICIVELFIFEPAYTGYMQLATVFVKVSASQHVEIAHVLLVGPFSSNRRHYKGWFLFSFRSDTIRYDLNNPEFPGDVFLYDIFSAWSFFRVFSSSAEVGVGLSNLAGAK